MARRLSDLPEELISNITCRLGDDKFALRATCRALETKSFHEFATEHFSGKCVHLTTDSLRTLLAISRSSRLSKYVKEVYFITALFSEQSFVCPGNPVYHWKPTVRQSEAYKFYINDQKTLAATGNDRAMLAEAFRGLSSLKTVVFTDSVASLPEGMDYRGSNKVVRQTGTRPISDHDPRMTTIEFRKHLEHLWSTLIHSIAEAHGYLSLEEFRTKVRTANSFINPLKHLSFDASVLSKLSKAFKNTTALHLHLKSPARKGWKEMVGNFGRTFSNLRALLLDFDMSPNSGPLYHKLALSVDMSRLTTLNILGLSVDAPRLASSITRLREIQDLKLYDVDVLSGTWPPVLKAMTKLEHLNHLHLMLLRENGHKSYFLEQRSGRPAQNGDSFLHNHWTEDDDDEDSDDLDDDMPELQPDELWIQPHSTSAHHATQEPAGNHSQDNHDETTVDDDDDISDYVPDEPRARSWEGERGFYICVKGHEKIAKRLPRFIEEYNVGDQISDIALEDDHFPMMLTTNMPAPPPGLGAFMAAIGNGGFGPFGPAPPPAPNNNPAGTNGNPPAAAHPPFPHTTTPPVAVPGATAATNAALGSFFGALGLDVGASDEGDWEDEEDALDGGEMD